MNKMINKINTKSSGGFTLVELSIVIVIIGFLVAGIAVGSNMIKQAEIRSVIGDLNGYQAAYNNFVSKYSKVPGDMDTAFSFWPTSCSDGNDPDVCNGNGNGRIEVLGSGDDEVRAALKHLSLANMISAGIPLIPSGNTSLVPGTNAPSSKISGAGYMMVSGETSIDTFFGSLPLAGSGFFGLNTNVLYIGKPVVSDPPIPQNLLIGVLKSEDAFGIDQKIDDAVISGATFIGANTGDVRVVDALDAIAGDCVNDNTTGGVFSDYTINTSSNSCILGIALN